MKEGAEDHTDQQLKPDQRTCLPERDPQTTDNGIEEKKHKRAQRTFNRRLVWFTGGLLFASIVANLIPIYQGSIAKQSADAATKAAATAENTFNLNKDFASKTLEEMQKQGKALQDASNAAKAQTHISQKTLDAAISISRTDQRAWVGVIRVSSNEPKIGQPLPVFIAYKNTGKTPAKNFTVSNAVEPVE
ncbi:MAG TPA: hypothetical protein VF357_08440 [Candidatus Deferrimicrobium sp.]